MLLCSARAATTSARLGQRAASSLALKRFNAVVNAVLQSKLIVLSSAIKSVPELNAFVSNPTLRTNDRISGLNVLHAAAEIPKKEPNGRLAEAHGVIEGFNELVSQYKGELTVAITSVAPLPSDIRRKLESSLKQSRVAQKAKSVKVAENLMIDLSVQSRVARLNSLLQLSV
ncbi:OSCP, subunit 5 of the stator stalk of mitochondrial F1F0 ATP synthase [Rhodofomes roseus]|uniref:OSCP, subunit 5 of the stator stalk of mitochondrial F1F0 ATP synthase n=1 Tax=Rhodofomes roseus TaxID=34475 RepID=A0ABQ8KKT4_9APHY|nr:OSCP, subunit 5 of the stator stalk of mitochondrial F1F0 ATP synthase [Rhodofomes roseus]KAH9838226.1 OSCP, subunit 5 of the stator stalk of mitochondrial F1F0 ATP synthase [Rhodofomes roseus]